MASVSTIKPFAFERVFSQAASSDAAKPDAMILQGEMETLRAQIERLELEKDMALAQARADGVQAGLAEARAERETAMLAAIDALQAGIEQIAEEVGDAVAKATAEAAELALATADLLAGRAIAAAPAETIDAALGRVLEQLGRNPRLQIRVHPSLVEEMERLVAARQAGERRRMHLHVAPDDTIPIGDTLISWDEGGLRLDMDARRNAVREELDGILG
ncbi:FliH/SctL family protein [Sphingosinicella sp. BN140058]|uniref:FliH/SctL family protein n=1 Tax=Sphingosinicella sp. BN140058 TaxID=1892855 RepID=UPI00101129B3|nr:FliH/SctL family protein [Sphingosinicella sp. BN140058]QAY76637.1 flagellar assembly protein FliH [Sphingosinicella sp. BN140058]